MDQLGQTDRSNFAGGRELRELIAHIKKNVASMDIDPGSESKIKVVVMIPENRAEPQKKQVSARAIHTGFEELHEAEEAEENEKPAKRTAKPLALLAAR